MSERTDEARETEGRGGGDDEPQRLKRRRSSLESIKVSVLRLGHRPQRDKRVTTHVMLAARALGASSVYYSGERDLKIEEKVREVTEAWGGPFEIEYVESWKRTLAEWKEKGGEVIHLTMYGLPIQEVIDAIKRSPRSKLVVVGGAKVPREVFTAADWNVAVTSQPHSEVSALAIFLHELFEGRELEKAFEGAKVRVVPQAKGKRVIHLS